MKKRTICIGLFFMINLLISCVGKTSDSKAVDIEIDEKEALEFIFNESGVLINYRTHYIFVPPTACMKCVYAIELYLEKLTEKDSVIIIANEKFIDSNNNRYNILKINLDSYYKTGLFYNFPLHLYYVNKDSLIINPII